MRKEGKSHTRVTGSYRNESLRCPQKPELWHVHGYVYGYRFLLLFVFGRV